MTKSKLHKAITYFIAFVWLVNGFFCKVLNMIPRHEQIVARVLGNEFSRPLTILIGLSEIAMCIWVLIGLKTRLNAIAQIAIVGAMNIIEFIVVPELLLWGRLNVLFALLFITLIYFNEFGLNKSLSQQT